VFTSVKLLLKSQDKKWKIPWLPINQPKGMIADTFENLNTGTRCWKQLGFPDFLFFAFFFFSLCIAAGSFRWKVNEK